MRNKSLLLRGSVGFVAIVLLGFAMDAGAAQRNKAQLKPPTVRDVRRMEALKEEVRHQLMMLPREEWPCHCERHRCQSRRQRPRVHGGAAGPECL